MARRKLPLSLVFLLLGTCRDSVAPATEDETDAESPVCVGAHAAQ